MYGVGADNQGWGDLIKSYIHGKIYGTDGAGETHEVFQFAKPGSTIEFIRSTCPWIVENYRRESAETTVLLAIGNNDAKASNEPTNYVCSTDEFRQKALELLTMLKREFDHVILVGNGYVDESKTSPKPSPFGDGRVSYFTNERRSLFNAITQEICDDLRIEYVKLDVDKDEWIKNYLSRDGLHPNQSGYDKVFEAIQPVLEKYV